MSITKESILDDLENERLPMPTLPEVAIKVRETVESEDSSIKDVADIIVTDAALSARIIHVANSALYRGMSSVETVQNAVMRLGMNTVRNLATSLVMKQLFQATHPVIDRYLRDVWKLSLDVASFSYVLAENTSLEKESALLAGLTHSIGISPILVKAESDPELLNDETRLRSLVDELHPAIGSAILSNWDFPPELAMVPTEHLNLTHVSDNGEADYADVVQTALIQTVMGSEHSLGQVDFAQSASMKRLGFLDDMEEVEMSGGIEEVKNMLDPM